MGGSTNTVRCTSSQRGQSADVDSPLNDIERILFVH